MAIDAKRVAVALACLLWACGGDSTPARDAGDGSPADTSSTIDSGAGDADASAPPPVDAGPGCGDGRLDEGEECDDGNDDDFDGCLSDCTEVPLVEAPEREWEYFEVAGTRCLNGEAAGFAVSYVPEATEVMLYLEGGGACFDDACDFTAFSIPFVPPIDGIFSRTNDRNPVRDWTMVYVPYCTGDIHAGDGEAELGGRLRQFRGYSNITRYLERLVPSFAADTVLLTGISAGGFGAAINASQVADAYGDDTQIVVLDDSGPPLSRDVIPPCLQQIFRETWNLDATVLAACPGCDPNDFATDLFTHVVETYPDMRIGLFSNTGDAIIRTYMGAGWAGGEYDNCDGGVGMVPRDTYAFDLAAIRAAHEDRVSTFYITGIGHTALRVGYYLTSVHGTALTDWVGGLVDGAHAHVGP